MTIHNKVIAVIVTIFIILMMILYLVLVVVFQHGFTLLEERDVSNHIQRVLNILSREIDMLHTFNRDWASWDETYSFIKDAHKEEYIKVNLVDSTFINARLNLMLFVNPSNQIVFGKAFDLEKEEEISLPEDLYKHLLPDSLLTKHSDNNSGIKGIILLSDSPLLISSQPILTSESKGPIRGSLIMGRYLDSSEIEHLLEVSNFTINIQRYDNSQISADFQKAILNLTEESPLFIQPLNSELVAGYALIKDIYGEPRWILRLDIPRNIYQQGQIFENYFILIFLAISILSSLLILLLLNRLILSPLFRVDKYLNTIISTKDLSSRIPPKGKDEISTLSLSINRMLDKFEELRKELWDSKEVYKNLFDNIPGGVYRIDNQGKITMMNTEGARLLGYASPQEVIGQNEEKVFYANPEDRKKYLQELEKNKGFLKDYEINLKRKDGTPLVISDTSHYYYDDEGKVAGIEGVFIDITERKEIEKELCYEQSLLHALLDHSLDSIYFKDRMKRFVRVNKRKAEKSKLTPEEMIGKTDFDFFSPDTAASSAQDDELVIESGKPLFNKEEKIIDKDQQVRWLSTTKVPWYNQEGKIIGLIGISRDITGRKRSEQLQQVLYNISKAANSAISLEELYSTIHQELGTVIDVTNFFIALVDEKKDEIYFPYHQDEKDNDFPILNFTKSKSLTAYVIKSKKPLFLRNEELKEMTRRKELLPEGTINDQFVWLGVPLKIEDKTIGAMAVQSYTNPQLYSEKDIELLEFISSQVAIAIERKRSEEALKERQQEFASLFHSTPEALVYLDEQGTILNLNPRFTELFGYTLEEIKGKNIDSGIIHPIDKLEEGKRLSEQSLQGYFYFETIRKKKDGTLFPVSISGSPVIIEGEIKGIIGTYIDLTPQKEIEEKIRQSEEKFSGIFFNIPEAAFYQDLEGTILEINPNFTKLFGYTREEVVGKRIVDEICLYPPDKVEEGRRLSIQAQAENITNFETIRLKKDGTPVWVSISSSTVKIKDKTVGVIALYRDITERKRSEQLQQVLYNISKAANSAISLEELYSTIHQELGTVIDVTNFNIALLNPQKESIQYIYFVDQEDKLDNPLEVDPAGTLANYVMRTEQPLLADIDLINEMIAKGELIRSNLGTLTSQTVWLGVPLKVEDRVIGVMAVLSYTNPQLYSEKDIELLEFISSQIAIAIERKQVEERIKYLSFHDALTGVYNRAYFEEELKRYNISRYYPLSLVMLDVNGLKVVNDTFGHNNGDRLLKHSTYILSSVCRQGDILARMGGDEFAILLPSTDYKEASRFCDRIRKACREDKVKPEYLRVSFSMGQVTQQGEYRDFSSLFKEADQRMYQDKLLNSQIREKHFLEIFLHLLKKRDPHIAGKSSRIQKWAISLGEEVGLSKKELKNLKYLVLFHNLGKLNIPEDILSKVVNLTPSEEKIIKKHPLFGYRIANNFISLVPIAREILYQYEQWDGSGYPEGLKGEQIPLLSRIILLVNDYHMLRTLSFQEQALNKEEALQKIKKYAGTRYDPHLVKLFCKIIDEEN